MGAKGLFLSVGEYCNLLSSLKSIKTCEVKRRNSIKKSGNARLYGGITVH